MLSSAALQFRRQEALINAGTVYGLIIGTNELAVQGREADALKALATITGALPFEIDAIKEVLAAEREAAKARDLTQRTLAPFFPRVGYRGLCQSLTQWGNRAGYSALTVRAQNKAERALRLIHRV